MDLKYCVIKSILSFCGFQNCIYVVVMPWYTVFVEKGGGKEGVVDKWVYALFSPCYDYFIFISEEMWENATDFKSVVLLLMCVSLQTRKKHQLSQAAKLLRGFVNERSRPSPLWATPLKQLLCTSYDHCSHFLLNCF